MRALSVRQPWAWAIAHGHKDVENRSWPTRYRGALAIHASARWDEDGAADDQVIKTLLFYGQHGGRFDPPLRIKGWLPDGDPAALLPDSNRFPLGAIVAVVDLADICSAREGCGGWAIDGQHHWRLADVQPLAVPVPCKGSLGLWELPADVEAAVREQIAEVAP